MQNDDKEISLPWKLLPKRRSSGPLVDLRLLDEIIHRLEADHNARVHLELSLADRRIDWAGLNVDPRGDFSPSAPRHVHRPRWPLKNGGCLEGQIFAQRGVIRIWRFLRNPSEDPVGHVVHDTRMPTGAAIGAVAGLLLSRGRAVVAAAGAAAGAATAHWVDRRPRAIWVLEDVSPDGQWKARRLSASMRSVSGES
ncbi:MAG: hypothetical protein ACE366_20825 [Bradymonadia bacterium]